MVHTGRKYLSPYRWPPDGGQRLSANLKKIYFGFWSVNGLAGPPADHTESWLSLAGQRKARQGRWWGETKIWGEVTRTVMTSGQSVVRRDEVRKSAQIKLNKWGKGVGRTRR